MSIPGFSDGSAVKSLSANAGDIRDLGSIPELARSPGGGNGNPLQYSCWENSVDKEAWWATVHGVTVRHNGTTNTHTHTLLRLSLHIPSGPLMRAGTSSVRHRDQHPAGALKG